LDNSAALHTDFKILFVSLHCSLSACQPAITNLPPTALSPSHSLVQLQPRLHR
jgi:hypothetical protein